MQNTSTIEILRQAFPGAMRLDLSSIARALDRTPGALRVSICQGSLPLRTYLDGGKRYADIRDVAAYLDELRGSTTKRRGPRTKADRLASIK